MKCTPFVTYDDGWEEYEPWEILCRYPVCKGWLPQDFPLDKLFKCKKCETELMVFPKYDENDGTEIEDEGKICPISHSSSPKVNE